MQQKKNNGKKNGINSKKRRRKGNRNRHKKGMKARKETKAKQGKTGKDQTLHATPFWTFAAHMKIDQQTLVARLAFVRKGHLRFCRF